MVRFYIGLTEAPFFPGLTLCMSININACCGVEKQELTLSSDIFVVYQGGVSVPYGHLARW
jgi:hypothetical protein